jgi:predicted HTH domain antitoxin
MNIVLPDEALRQAGFDEQRARVEFACWLYDAGRLDLWPAAQVAGLSRVEFEAELLKRGLAIYRYTESDFAQDMATAEKIGL